MFRWAPIPSVPLLLSFILGILWYSSIPNATNIFTLILLFGLLIAISAINKLKIMWQHITKLRTILTLASFTTLAYVWCSLIDVRNHEKYIGQHLQKATSIMVTASEAPIEKTKTWLLPAKIIAYKSKNSSFITASGKTNIYFYKQEEFPTIQEGDTLVFPNKLVAIQHNGNPFSFNYAQYASYQQLYYQGFYAFKDIGYKSDFSKQELTWIKQWRQSAIQALKRNIKDTTTLSISLAMLLNERALLHDDIWKSYADTGIIHIISISGMHIQIFLVGIIFCLRWIKNNKYKWIKYLIAAVIVWLYISMTLHPASAVRAGFMFSITALAIRLNQQESPINSLAAAALIMLCIEPFWLYNLGFQLSFLCMLSIYLFYKPIKNFIYLKNKWLRYLWEGVAMSVAVQILVAPIVIYYFHQFPLFVFLVNIPAAIYSTVMMWGNIAIALFGNIFPLEWLGNLLAYLTIYFNHLVAFFARITPKSLSQFALDKLDVLLLTTILALIAYFFCYHKNKKIIYTALSVFAIYCCSIITERILFHKQERLIVYQTTRNSTTQVIKGNTQYCYYTDSLQLQQVTKTPSLHWYINDKFQKLPSAAIFHIHKYSAAILDQMPLDTTTIDLVILTQNNLIPANELIHICQPKLIILDGSLPRWKAEKYLNENSKVQIPIYSVTLSGAFIYPSI